MYSACCSRETGFSRIVLQSWDSQSLTALLYPQQEMLQPDSVHTVTVTLVEGWHWQSSFFSFCCIETHLFSCFFFHTWCARIFPPEGLDFYTFSRLCLFAQGGTLQVFPTMAGRRLASLLVSQPIPWSVCLFPNAHVGKTPPGSFDMLLLGLTGPTGTLLWMGA